MTARQSGFTVVEVMGVVAALGLVVGIFGTISVGLHKTERHSGAYVADLSGLRRAIRTIEGDLREGREPRYTVVDGVLKRDGVVLAQNIAVLEIARTSRLATVVIGLRPRRDVASARRPVVTFKVWRRA